MDRVRVCFIGCGRHATLRLYSSIVRVPLLVELVACCDIQEELAKRNAQLFGAKEWYTDWEKMLDEQKPDGVFIVGPPTMHVELGIACFEKGYHVFVEKPSAMTVEDGRRLAEAMERSGKFGQVGFMMRHAPLHHRAKEIATSPEFGKLLFVESKYFMMGPRQPVWGLDDADWAYLIFNGVHPVDLARHFGGEVRLVTAQKAQGKEGRCQYQAEFSFDNGAVGFISTPNTSPCLETRLELLGDNEAYLTVENMANMRYLNPKVGVGQIGGWEMRRPSLIETAEERLGFVGEVAHFAQSILNNTLPYPNLRDGYEAVRVVSAMWKSIHSRQPVELSKEN